MARLVRIASPVLDTASRLLLQVSREVTSTLDLGEVLVLTFGGLHRIVEFGGGAIQLVEDGFLVAAATDPPATQEALTVRIRVGEGISGAIAATGEPIYIPDIWADPRVDPSGARKGVSSGVRSYFGAPLILHGEPIGVVQIDSPELDAFTPSDRALVLAFAPAVAAAVQNAQLFRREREAVAHMADVERIKRNFLALVSHELRTPLTTVSGFGHTLAHHAAALDTTTVADIGKRVWRAGRRLERVMSELLDLSQIERGTFALELVPTDVGSVARAATREQDDGDHELVVTVGPDVPLALADPDRLRQAIGNLVANARKFSPAGTRISVDVGAEPACVAVRVTDQGKGIPQSAAGQVFDGFFQVEPTDTRSTEGLGLGLYVVRELCSRMRATIDVHTSEGAGTRLTVRLPRADRAGRARAAG